MSIKLEKYQKIFMVISIFLIKIKFSFQIENQDRLVMLIEIFRHGIIFNDFSKIVIYFFLKVQEKNFLISLGRTLSHDV